jgi:hypothetical protein
MGRMSISSDIVAAASNDQNLWMGLGLVT